MIKDKDIQDAIKLLKSGRVTFARTPELTDLEIRRIRQEKSKRITYAGKARGVDGSPPAAQSPAAA